MKNNEMYLNHILQRCRKIEKITSEHTLEDLFENEDLQDILTRSLEIIGEATANISEDFREEHTDIPWGQMKGMRNVLIHQYFRVDLEFVWGTALNDVPVLRQKVEEIIKEFVV